MSGLLFAIVSIGFAAQALAAILPGRPWAVRLTAAELLFRLSVLGMAAAGEGLLILKLGVV